jgi:hypothetical protein
MGNRHLEKDVLRNRTGEPGVLTNLGLQLPGAPTGASKGDDEVFWSVALADGGQQIDAVAQGQLRIDVKAPLPFQGRTVKNENLVGMHRAADVQRHIGDLVLTTELQLGKHVPQTDVGVEAVDDHPHGALVVVDAQADDGVGKIGIQQAGHGDEKLSFERLRQ